MESDHIGVGSRLFCTAAPSLDVGVSLKPGDFQQRLMAVQVLAVEVKPIRILVPNPAMTGHALQELAWETVRANEFPDRPSRLSCLFFWRTEGQARDFHSRRPWPTGLYEAEVTRCDSVFVADMNRISYFEKAETVESMFKRARRYWSNVCTEGEVLLRGDACVTRVLEKGRPVCQPPAVAAGMPAV